MGTHLIWGKINRNRKETQRLPQFYRLKRFITFQWTLLLYLVQFLALFKIVSAQSPSKITPEKCTTYPMKHLSHRSADLHYITC